MEGSKAYSFLHFVAVLGIATCFMKTETPAPAEQNATTQNFTMPSKAPETTESNSTLTSRETEATNNTVGWMVSSVSATAESSRVTQAASTVMSAPPSKGATQCLLDRRTGTQVVIALGVLVLVCAMLLVSTVTLACQVCHLKGQPRTSRPLRSNADLLTGTGYWGTATNDARGAAETNVLLTDMKPSDAGNGTVEAAADEGGADETEKPSSGKVAESSATDSVSATAPDSEPAVDQAKVEIEV